MSPCECEQPIPCPDDGRCAKCTKPCVAALMDRPDRVTVPIDEWDALLQYRRRVHYQARNQ